MIERDYNLYILVCDSCGEEYGTYDSFEEAVAAKKKLNFVSKREGKQWIDICEDCQNE